MASAITHRNYCVSPTKNLSFLTSKETMRSLSDVPIYPAKKSRTNISREPQESSFLASKETYISISDVPISPGKKNRASMSLELRKTTQDPFLPSNETEISLFSCSLSTSPAKKSQTSMSQEPQETSPMNTDEALKSHCFWQNPNYLKSDLSSRYQSYFSLGSQRFSGQFLMIPYPGFVDLSSNNLSVQSVFTYSSSLTHQEQQPSKIEEVRILSKEQKEKEEHILKNLPPEDAQKMDRGKPGLKVKVYDHDTDTSQELCLAFQRSYVLKDGWYISFIKRRGLREREEIGLFWDFSDSKLHFSVLSRKSSCYTNSSCNLSSHLETLINKKFFVCLSNNDWCCL